MLKCRYTLIMLIILWNLSARDNLALLNLSTRDSLDLVFLNLFVYYAVEPLYKGQFGPWNLCTRDNV